MSYPALQPGAQSTVSYLPDDMDCPVHIIDTDGHRAGLPATEPVLKSKPDALGRLRNIGKAMRADFDLLGIDSVAQLACCDADELYARIQTLTQNRHDPCVWDTYAAAIHQARTGEALPWWDFTRVRKQRQAMGSFGFSAHPQP